MIENSNAKKKKKENTGNDTKSEKKVLDMHPKSPEGDYLYDESISYIDTWKQCEKLIFADKVKTLGLANWNIDQINKVLQLCACKPQLVQAELSPLLQQKSLIQFCKERGIVVSAYGPQGSLTTASDGLTAMKKKMTAQLKELDPHAEKIEDDSPMLKTVMRLALKKKQMEENAAETAEGEKKVTIAEEPSNETPRQPVETAETTEEKPVETEELTETSETCIEKQPLESQRSVESSTLEAAETASTTTTTAPAKKSVRSRPPKKSTKKAGGRKRSISKEQQAIEDANQALTQTRRTSIADLETTRQNYGISNHNQNFNTSALKFNEEMKIRAIASSHNSLSSHVVSRWALQLGCILVQSSWEVSSIRNANKVFTFELKKKEMDTLNEMNKYHRSFQFDEFKGHKFYPFKNELEMMEQHAMELLKNEPLSRPMKSPTKGMDEMSINDENVKDPLERKFSTEDQIKQIARRESLKPGPSGRPVGQTRWK